MLTKVRILSENMNEAVFEKANGLAAWVKEHAVIMSCYIAVGTCAFFMLISHDLVNNWDGVWYNSRYYAGTWELSIGRWFWLYLDQFRFGIASSSLNSFVTLALLAVGNALLTDLFAVKRKFPAILAGSLFIATPLICDSLTFGFMSVTFGTAYFLSVLSAFCAVRFQRAFAATLSGGLLLACSMGCYQAYFGITCLVLLFYILAMLLKNTDGSILGKTVLRAAGTILTGGILYRVILSINLAVHDVDLSGYRGADTISAVSIVKNLPANMMSAYKSFYLFYFTDSTQKPMFGLREIYILAFIIAIWILLQKVMGTLRHSVWKGLLAVLAILCIPLACCAVLLLVGGENNLLMAGGLTLLFPLTILLLDDFMERRVLYIVYLVMMSGMLWVNVCIVANDQLALWEGRETTLALARSVVTELMIDDNIDENTQIAFVGCPSDSACFQKTEAWEWANGYAQFGTFSTEAGLSSKTWEELLSEYGGMDLNFCSGEIYNIVLEDGIVEEMTNYPAEGSIQYMRDINTVVVRISDNY
ncbi:MAG: glucosyltransferase domain-containing protein [Lachnospiraceae bacterium]|nr:glucosyltransferase domain-containing protein [Lachnospiraceae bacterium]